MAIKPTSLFNTLVTSAHRHVVEKDALVAPERWTAIFPKGIGLSHSVWQVRHGLFLLLLWAHVASLPLLAWVFGRHPLEGLAAAAIVGVLAFGASVWEGSRRTQSVLVSIGLATASGVIVHLSGGYIEFHFHYFVLATLLVLYQDWAPFLTMITFVAVEHGVLGVLHPHSVYNHPAAIASPWTWAAIHAVYIGAACAASIVAWRKTEQYLEAVQAANTRLEEEVHRRKAAEQALRQAHDGLERQVHQRTADVKKSNEALVQEMGERRRAEESLRQAMTELQCKQSQLVQAAKLASLGEMAAGVAHELNNPLNNISLSAGNLLDRVNTDMLNREQARTELHLIHDQVGKAAKIINELRTFSRTAQSDKTPVWVNHVIESALTLLQQQFRVHNVKLETNLTPDQPIVMGNAIHLEQVLINVLMNAKDALEAVHEKCLTVCSMSDGRWVEVTVQDSGPGMSPDMAVRIFDPFFTTKAVGKGTGLGLSISYGIIKEHGGTITVESQPASGATFRIRLPLADGPQLSISTTVPSRRES